MLDEIGVKRRRSSDEVADRKVVRAIVAPVVQRMNALQRECAFLNAQLSHFDRAPFEPRIVNLGREVANAILELDAAVAQLPPRQQSHSRVLDLRRAFEQLSRSMPRLP